MIEGGANQWAIIGGNAQSGGLSTFFSGVRPPGYNPMHKEGAILLGIGGDNSNGGAGTFYEGVMTSGYPSAATENAVQANITAAGYGSGGGGGGSTGAVHAVGAGKCLDDPNSTTTLATQMQIWDCNGGTNQTWTHTSSEPADPHRRRHDTVPGRQRAGHQSRHQGHHLELQRPGQPAVEPQLQRHHHRRAVRPVPGRDRSVHRQRRPGRTVDLQRQSNQQWRLG